MPRFADNEMAFGLSVDVLRHWLCAMRRRGEALDLPHLPPVVMSIAADGTYEVGVVPREIGEPLLSGDGQPLAEMMARARSEGEWMLLAVEQELTEIDPQTLGADTSAAVVLRACDGVVEQFAAARWTRLSDRPGDIDIAGWESVEASHMDMRWVAGARHAYPANASD